MAPARAPPQVLPPASPNDVRMDGVAFFRAGAGGTFQRRLPAGNFSYCVAVRAGRLRLEIDFPAPVRISLEPGDVVALSGLAPHIFQGLSGPPSAAAVFDLLPMASEGPVGEVALIVGAVPNEGLALGSLSAGPIHVRPADFPDLSRRLWQAVAMLEDEYADVASIDQDLVIRRLAEIMLVNLTRRLLLDRPPEGDAAGRVAESRRLMQAINAVFEAPERPWTLVELARAAGMSRTRFAEAFKRATGQTPGRIVSRLRLTAIARRLADEPLSIEAAAEEAGYSSSAAFVRAFQREFGQTPARWRRQRRGPSARLRPARPDNRRLSRSSP
ncbi:MAG: helix-turn-helix transcriptional regulator [Proteobacteria bacterium]|nr:helix-turn-helix transcriptional regulator [Pseudomonadota bacterium]